VTLFDLTLSFDNGPTADVTPFVLDLLARRGIKSTFFVIGEKVARPENRVLAERAHAEGHWIGNHTWSHSLPFGLMQPEAANAEFDRTRPVLDHLAQARATIVLWSALPRDWQDPDGWVQRALDQCAAIPWSLMVLHDLPTGAMRHLDRFIGLILDRGGRIRQEFPPDCLPMVDGEMKFGIEDYISASS
jgi:peptidoglycan-N-acetylglucosamine deacetylase